MDENAIHKESDSSNSSLRFKGNKKLDEKPVLMSPTASSLLPEVFRAAPLTNGSEIEKMEAIGVKVEASGGQNVGDDGAPVVVFDVQDRWVDKASRNLYYGYTNAVPDTAPGSSTEVSPFNPTLWAEHAGGVTRGVVLDDGVTSRRRRRPPARSKQNLSAIKKSKALKKELVRMKKLKSKSNKKLKMLKALMLTLLEKAGGNASKDLIEHANLVLNFDDDDGDGVGESEYPVGMDDIGKDVDGERDGQNSGVGPTE